MDLFHNLREASSVRLWLTISRTSSVISIFVWNSIIRDLRDFKYLRFTNNCSVSSSVLVIFWPKWNWKWTSFWRDFRAGAISWTRGLFLYSEEKERSRLSSNSRPLRAVGNSSFEGCVKRLHCEKCDKTFFKDVDLLRVWDNWMSFFSSKYQKRSNWTLLFGTKLGRHWSQTVGKTYPILLPHKFEYWERAAKPIFWSFIEHHKVLRINHRIWGTNWLKLSFF